MLRLRDGAWQLLLDKMLGSEGLQEETPAPLASPVPRAAQVQLRGSCSGSTHFSEHIRVFNSTAVSLGQRQGAVAAQTATPISAIDSGTALQWHSQIGEGRNSYFGA